jgi:hypothetical protein
VDEQIDAKQEQPAIEHEDRIKSDNDLAAFQAMGYTGRLSDNMVTIYEHFKAKKDRLQPGRFSPEGLAMVATLAAMVENDLNLE